MIKAPVLNPTNRPVTPRRTPRHLPGWLQVSVLLLLISQGLQALSHRNEPSLTANTDQTAPSTAPLARIAYYYNPDRTIATGNMQPTFQYASYYAHASSVMNVTPVRAYDPTPGRWLDRDPIGTVDRSK